MENLLKDLEILRERAIATAALIGVDRIRERSNELKRQMTAPDFWRDREQAVAVSKEAEDLGREAGLWEALGKEIRDLEELVAEAVREGTEDVAAMAHEQYRVLVKRYEQLEFFVLFSGKYDEANAIVSIHAGTGGTDAQDWAEMLERMFLRFSERHGYQSTLIDRTVGQEAGIKGATYHVRGRWAYGYLKSENGVHRLVRISPFDAEQMRHTSFALVEVIPELKEADTIDIQDKDIRVDVFRSSGPGGQGVNTTDSAVRIVHLPTNIVVTCQNERSQHQNRETAMRVLKAKLFQLEVEKREAEELKLRGEAQKAEWGKQIRSYVLQPYRLVKDHRTQTETQDVDAVLNGDIDRFIEAYLRKRHTR